MTCGQPSDAESSDFDGGSGTTFTAVGFVADTNLVAFFGALTFRGALLGAVTHG